MQSKFQDILEAKIINAQSFLLFRQPQSEFVELWGNDGIETSNQFVFHSFQSDKEIVFHTNEILKIPVNELSISSSFQLPTSSQQEAISHEDYIKLITKTVDFLKDESNTSKKVVISRIKEIPNDGIDLIQTFKKLHFTYPKAYVYLWFTPDEGLWIGASPELLLEEENLEIKTVSLAGTLPKDENWTSKEIHEQQVVTDYIVSKLKETTDLKVDGPHTVDAGFFNHLKSYISAKVLAYNQVKSILQEMHPTPAVCGMPKKNAKDFILKNEGYDRKFYAGYFGYKTPTKSLYFVNLRCAQVFANVVKLYVGGGIMPDSIPEKEWTETEMKSKTIGNLLVTDKS